MELRLGRDSKSRQIVNSDSWRPSWCLQSRKHYKIKHSFPESYGQYSLKPPPPLLVWSGQPNEEDDRSGKKHRKTYTANQNNNKEEEKHVVGWPPIKSWRKKKLHDQHSAGGQIRIQER